MIRHSESVCSVTVETDDGHTLQWSRTKKGVRYVINGREVDRLRGSVPDDLHNLFRLPLVESADGAGEFNIHFGEQKRPIFLLDQNGRQAAAFFASSSDAALLMEMQAQHKKRVTERRQDERTLAAEVDRHQRLLTALAPAPDLAERTVQLESLHSELTLTSQTLARLETETQTLLTESDRATHWQTSHDELQRLTTPPELANTADLEDLVEEVDTATQWLHQVLARHGGLAGLPEVPEMAPADEVAELVEQLSELRRDSEFATQCDGKLASLLQPPEIEDRAVLERLIEQIDEHELASQKRRATASQLTGLSEPPAESNFTALSELIEELSEARVAEREFASLHGQLANLDEPPEPQGTDSGAGILASLDGASAQVAMLVSELESVDRQRQDALSELFAWAEENPTCPICGGAVDPDSLVACHDDSSAGAAS